MKKLLFTLCMIGLTNTLLAQSELYVTLWYGQVKNADVQEHLELEKEFYSEMWQEQIDQGNILGWDMWQIMNPDVNDMTTTFIYATLHTTPTFNVSPMNSISGKSDSDWRSAQERQMSHYLKSYSLVTSVKGGYGPQMEGAAPPFAVVNYMAVDPYRFGDYEKAELETFMPMFKESDTTRKGWGLHKILNRGGSDENVNYLTVDFYDSMETILSLRDATSQMSEEDIAMWREFDDVRKLTNFHIIKLLMHR